MRRVRGQYGLDVCVRGEGNRSLNGSGHGGSLNGGGSDRVVGHPTTAPKSMITEYAPNEHKAMVPSFRLAEEATKRRAAEAEIVALKAELQASQARVKELERTFIRRKRTLSLASC
jgi:hypothetical protein